MRLQLQPPLRGCVLKQSLYTSRLDMLLQPPLRGCVLKQTPFKPILRTKMAAASARLCVETLDGFGKLQELGSSRLCAAVC